MRTTGEKGLGVLKEVSELEDLLTCSPGSLFTDTRPRNPGEVKLQVVGGDSNLPGAGIVGWRDETLVWESRAATVSRYRWVSWEDDGRWGGGEGCWDGRAFRGPYRFSNISIDRRISPLFAPRICSSICDGSSGKSCLRSASEEKYPEAGDLEGWRFPNMVAADPKPCAAARGLLSSENPTSSCRFRATCAAITRLRSDIRLHLPHVQFSHLHHLLCPLRGLKMPWFLHLAQVGAREDGDMSD